MPALARTLLAGTFVATAAFASSASAQLSFVSTRAGLSNDGQVDWGTRGAQYTAVDNTSTVGTGIAGVTAVVSKTSAGAFERRNQGSGWGGNFTTGDALLWTNGTSGPLVLTFNQAIAGFGLQLQSDSYGAFVGSVTAYDLGGLLLGSFQVDGNSTGASDGSAVFLGVSSVAGDIGRVQFDVVGGGDFAVNRGTVGASTAAAVVPEPSTYAMLGAGLLSLGAAARRRRA
jgi:hypothetical protein